MIKLVEVFCVFLVAQGLAKKGLRWKFSNKLPIFTCYRVFESCDALAVIKPELPCADENTDGGGNT